MTPPLATGFLNTASDTKQHHYKDYDEEREMEPRPEPRREATPTLRLRSHVVCRQRERVMGFEDAPNREGNRKERNAEGLSSSGRTKNSFPYWFLRWERGFLHLFEWAIRMLKWLMLVACNMFTYTLKDSARIWWNSQKIGSILNYEDLKAKFWSHFSQQKKFTKTHLAVHNIKQREGESTRAFITRYIDDTLQILGLHEEQQISGFVLGLRTRSLVEHLSTNLPSTYKGLMEKTYTWVEAREVATNGVSNDPRDIFERSKKSSWDNNRGQKDSLDLLPSRGLKILVGFQRQQSWPLEKYPLEVMIGGPHAITFLPEKMMGLLIKTLGNVFGHRMGKKYRGYTDRSHGHAKLTQKIAVSRFLNEAQKELLSCHYEKCTSGKMINRARRQTKLKDNDKMLKYFTNNG
ncbi:reverse transcriptase domain-containing protein [Tanacetum coccineum]